MAELMGKEKSDAKQGPKPRLGEPMEESRLDCELRNLLSHGGRYLESDACWKRIMRIIGEGADVNAQSRADHRTALDLASMVGRLDACRFLLENGAPVDSRDSLEETPLMHAAHCGRHEICAFLIEKGADVNAVNVGNCTALMYAAKANDIAGCKVLLENGARLWAKNVSGSNAMDFAKHNKMDAYYFLQEWGLRKIMGKAAKVFVAAFRECVKG
jgi:uncharacterized protein